MAERAFRRIASIEGAFRAAEFALGEVLTRARREPLKLPNGMRPRDLQAALYDLEVTYTVRLFAEFEAVLRRIWNRAGGGKIRAAKGLVNRLGARFRVSSEDLLEVHAVRRWRNDLVHNEPPGLTLTLPQCRSRLSRFLGYVRPRAWLND